MKTPSFIKKTTIIALALVGVIVLCAHTQNFESVKQQEPFYFLEYKVLAFADKHKDKEVIVVSKKDHLLYYCRNGTIVRNDKWNGFTFTFPVKVALANKYHRTPEGEMFVDYKNRWSRYTRFLSLSTPGAYGIHGGSTRVARYLDRMEKKDPNFEFVTKKDDTRGCVAVENRVIKYLFAKVEKKTPVLIMP